ncbi:MAG TPA: methyltransferase domain-containing protein [Candidatus Kapabacteria bacterium]|nr:methyltransferase domain-containing protein [Candidatus Kapabacteria bacterium]
MKNLKIFVTDSALKYDFIAQLDNPSNTHSIQLSFVPEGSYVLDVGCHSGIFAEALRIRKNARVVGIDTDTAALVTARTRMSDAKNLDIEVSGWEDILSKQGWREFDAIVFGDVLEHTRDPESILAAAKKLLKRDGRIVVSIPNVAHWRVRFGLLFGKFQYAASGILDKTHLRFYTKQSARELIEQSGYTIITSDVAGYSLPHRMLRFFPSLLAVQFVFAATSK